MPFYEFQGLDAEGKSGKGRLEAADPQQAQRLIHQQGYQVTAIQEVSPNPYAARMEEEIEIYDLDDDLEFSGLREDGSYLYQALPQSDWKTAMYFVGAAFGILTGIFGFVVALVGDVGQLAMHSMSTFPMLIGVFSLLGGLASKKKRHSVILDHDGVQIFDRPDDLPHKIAWSEIAHVKEEINGFAAQKQMNFFGYDGKKIKALSDQYENAAEMFEVIEDEVDKHANEEAAAVKSKGDRKAAGFVLCAGLGFGALCLAIAWMTYESNRQDSLLESEGIPGVASIEKRIVAPNGKTKRLHYKVQLEDGEDYAVENVEVTDEYFESLEDETEVPVIYAESNPNISKLESGQVFDGEFLDTPVGGYGLAGLGSLLALFLVVIGTLQLLGFDLGVPKA